MLEFGNGFDESNLRNMRKFYLAFPIRDALRPELSWTHYRIISRIEDDELRLLYLQQFIMELGKGFAFVARQQHIVTDTSDFYIDLVFYNYFLFEKLFKRR